MPTSDSSFADDEQEKLDGPGHRTGEGSESVLPYLHDALASRPGELYPGSGPPGQRSGGKSIASRVRRALLRIRKAQGGNRAAE